MNGLSWLLYFADVSEALRLFSNFGWIVSALVSIGVSLFWMIIIDNNCHNKEAQKEITNLHGRVWWFFFPAFVIFMLMYIVVPQRQTFMLIAASEFGEEILNNTNVQAIGGEAGDLAVDSLSLLRKYINEQLEEDVVPSNPQVK